MSQILKSHINGVISRDVALQKKGANSTSEGFSIRVKLGEYEVELSGTHREVMKTIEKLPEVLANVNKAFECAKPKTVATITVKTADENKPVKPTKPAETSVQSVQSYPKIEATEKAEQAVLKALDSEWGKWRPRTVQELKQALQNSQLNFPERALTSALNGLSKKGRVRRWNTNTGFVYILSEPKTKTKGAK